MRSRDPSNTLFHSAITCKQKMDLNFFVYDIILLIDAKLSILALAVRGNQCGGITPPLFHAVESLQSLTLPSSLLGRGVSLASNSCWVDLALSYFHVCALLVYLTLLRKWTDWPTNVVVRRVKPCVIPLATAALWVMCHTTSNCCPLGESLQENIKETKKHWRCTRNVSSSIYRKSDSIFIELKQWSMLSV